MHPTQTGQKWYFAMNIHVGVNVSSGVAHTIAVTSANASDVSQTPCLLREDDPAVFGDAGYFHHGKKRGGCQAGVFWGVPLKARPQRQLTAGQRYRNRRMSSIRSRVEHLLRVLQCQFGYQKVRYKGLAKNAAQVFRLIGLTNRYLKRRALLD
jgi:IS5 family transposase